MLTNKGTNPKSKQMIYSPTVSIKAIYFVYKTNTNNILRNIYYK